MLDDRADKACRSAFATYVGVPYDQSMLQIGWYSPTRASWLGGDHDAACALRDPAGRLVGTMKGSRR